MPRHECCDALVQLVGHRALEIEVQIDAPAQVSFGIVVDETHRAARRQQHGKNCYQQKSASPLHQKLSTVIWPGARRRCLRMPRDTSAAVASFSMAGLPQSMTCELPGASSRPAAASRRPSAIAAGMRPASEPGALSRLTNVT